MTEYSIRLFQAHVNEDPNPIMCFAKSVDVLCHYLLPKNGGGVLLGGVVCIDATDAWLSLTGEVGRATRDALAQGAEGIATYGPDKYGNERWVFHFEAASQRQEPTQE